MQLTLAHVLIASSSLLLPLSGQAQSIRVDYTGTVTEIGTLLAGNGVDVGSTLAGSFTYDVGTGIVSQFSHAFGNGFTAHLAAPVNLFVQNDQQNGSATLAADGLIVGGSSISNTDWNGLSNPAMQFGLRQDNAAGQLWHDTLPPDLHDWSLVSLAAINGPGWRWLDFNVPNLANFADDQIRFSVVSYSVAAVPLPAGIWLFLSGVMAALGLQKRKAFAKAVTLE
ncbi:hypothetical protein [Methylomonas sp. DH-1]|uniref:hypothetical protein n=1 Tax=Methylomonas sp. (strain DH-1) TaxID=1727196 RepID=UPI0007C8D42F|nr:hypothetical protein [Methylomonas sp. DH-1]ANE55796.1 hypothetical protein AYM39_11790 [Methylomonas sp. DH-1]